MQLHIILPEVRTLNIVIMSFFVRPQYRATIIKFIFVSKRKTVRAAGANYTPLIRVCL